MKGRPIPYSAEELAWLESHKSLPRRELHQRFCTAFGRTDVKLGTLTGMMKRRGWGTGRSGRFEPGQAPHNKGKPMRPETKAKLAGTWFQKGHRPHTTKYLGHERLNKDGYIEISIDEPNPYTGFERRYVLKHRYLWERANGPVPDGHALKCLDGDKTNTDPSNWEAVPRALLPRLSGGRWHKPYDQYEPEVRPAVLTLAKLEHKARTIRRRGDD